MSGGRSVSACGREALAAPAPALLRKRTVCAVTPVPAPPLLRRGRARRLRADGRGGLRQPPPLSPAGAGVLGVSPANRPRTGEAGPVRRRCHRPYDGRRTIGDDGA